MMDNQSAVYSINEYSQQNEWTDEIIQVINYVFICGVISVIGTATNVINMIVFYKQGLDTTINISFFALAVSDLCSLLMQQCYNLFVNPWLEDVGVPGPSSGVQFIIAGVPRECFARITFLITVYITAERCFCITFPLHIKQMITPRTTAVVVIAFYSVVLLSCVPLYCTTFVIWKVNIKTNITVLCLTFSSYSFTVEGVVMVVQVVTGTVSFLLIILFTMILIRKLSQKSEWRKASTTDQKQNESTSIRDRRTMMTVVLIATILIVSYTPSVILFLWTFIDPEFSIIGKYSSLYTCCWSFACVLECINSSVNILLYYKMSTKYKETFHELITIC